MDMIQVCGGGVGRERRQMMRAGALVGYGSLANWPERQGRLDG